MQTQESENFYNAEWGKRGMFKDIAEGQRMPVAVSLIKKCDRQLDIGCGEGSLAMLAKNKYREIYGVDVSEKALDFCNVRGYTQVYKIDLNEGGLPFADNFFDYALCLAVIEHVIEPENLIEDINRILKPGGTIIISTPNIRYFRFLFKLVVKGRFPATSALKKGFNFDGHLHYFCFRDVEELLRQCGFSNFQWYRCGSKKLKNYYIGRNIFQEFLTEDLMIKANK